MDYIKNKNIINHMKKEKVARNTEIINQMKAAINNTENAMGPATISSHQATLGSNPFSQNQTTPNQTVQNSNTIDYRNQSILNSNYQNLANNQNFSINTISKEANRYRENLAPNLAPQTFVTQTPYTPNFTQPPTNTPNINQNPFIQH